MIRLKFNVANLVILVSLVVVPLVFVLALNAGGRDSGEQEQEALSVPSERQTQQEAPSVPSEGRKHSIVNTPIVIDRGVVYMDAPTPDPRTPTLTPDPTEVARRKQLDLLASLRTQQGRVLAEWTAPNPLIAAVTDESIEGVTGYRIEEVLLPEPSTFMLEGNRPNFYGQGVPTTVDKVWRLTIMGQFTGIAPRSLPYAICSNDVLLGQTNGYDKLILIVFDRTLLPEGGTISVAYGTTCGRTGTLPEKIHYK